jgi:Leucine-rich repeat (LRR) protein
LIESLRKLSNLENLVLTGNKITEIPIWLGELPKIQNIEMYDLPLQAFYHQFILDDDAKQTATNCKRLSRLISTIIQKIKTNQALDAFEINYPNYFRYQLVLDPICQKFPNAIAQQILRLLNATDGYNGDLLL